MKPVTDFALRLARWRYERAMARGRGVDDALAALETLQLRQRSARQVDGCLASAQASAPCRAMPIVRNRNCQIYVRRGRELQRVA